MSHITTHILDTAVGKPAAGVKLALYAQEGKTWKAIAKGTTNQDGRVGDLLGDGEYLAPGIYKIVFETKAYFDRQKVDSFYPHVPVVFEITDQSHYHVPLLLNPFGYSTYRGS